MIEQFTQMHSKFSLTYILKDPREVTFVGQIDNIISGVFPPCADKVDPHGVDLLRVKARNERKGPDG